MSDAPRDALRQTVISVLEDTVLDWDMEIEGGIGPKTTLIGDLAFESIDIVQFCVALEQKFDRKGMPFEKLFINDGSYVDDVSVDDIVSFIEVEMVAS